MGKTGKYEVCFLELILNLASVIRYMNYQQAFIPLLPSSGSGLSELQNVYLSSRLFWKTFHEKSKKPGFDIWLPNF